MKTKLLTALLLAIAVIPSCESTIEMGEDGQGEVLIMNARMSTADTSHVIWLAYGTQHGVSSALDGVVSCFVNGELVATVDRVSEVHEKEDKGKKYFGAAGYLLDARIAPGDHVSIQAEAGKHHCRADVDVLPAPTILEARAFPSETDSDRQFGPYGLEIRIQDQHDVLNYHYLRILEKSHVLIEKADVFSSYKAGDILDREEKEIRIITTGEPLLNTGARILGDQGSSQASFFDNEENLFTDLLFRDGEYTMRVFTNERFKNGPKTMDSGDSMIVYTTAVVRVFNISREDYLSLSGYQFSNSKESETYLTEEFVFPNNVKGGIGFVSVEAAVDYEIAFPTRRVTIDTWPNGTVIEE